MVRLAFIGDVMLGRMVDLELAQHPPDSFWGSTLPVLRSADAVFANLECAISARGAPWSRTPKTFFFRARPAATAVLKAADIRYVSLANNHILDFGADALQDTLQHLDAVGIAHAGAGMTLAEAQQPALLDVRGLTIAVIALTDNEPPFAALPDGAGTYYIPIRDEAAILAPLEAKVQKLRNEGADLIVLSPHWGPNMVSRPPDAFRRFALHMIGSGVDIIHGHSAHVFQGVECRQRRLILYDTGDFIDDYATDWSWRNDWSFIFLVDIGKEGLRRLGMVPVRLGFAKVDLATGYEAGEILRRMTMLCAELGTEVTEIDGRLELSLASAGWARRPAGGFPA